MKEQANWIIIDLKRSTALYGIKNLTLRFTTQEIAHEVAQQFFEKRDEYTVVEINVR